MRAFEAANGVCRMIVLQQGAHTLLKQSMFGLVWVSRCMRACAAQGRTDAKVARLQLQIYGSRHAPRVLRAPSHALSVALVLVQLWVRHGARWEPGDLRRCVATQMRARHDPQAAVVVQGAVDLIETLRLVKVPPPCMAVGSADVVPAGW